MIRQSFWVYLSGNVSSAFGLVFWITVSLFVSTSVVGSIAAVLAFQSLLTSIVGVGFSAGLQRLLSQSRGGGDSAQLHWRFMTSLKIQFALGLPVAGFILILSAFGITFLSLSATETVYAVVLYLLTFWPPIYVALYRSFLKTEIPALAQVISSVLKPLVCILLLFLGFGFDGTMFAIIITTVTSDTILATFSSSLIRAKESQEWGLRPFLVELLKAGFPSWIPSTLTVLAESIGIFLIYGIVSQSQTGLYMIAFAISTLILSLPASINGMMFPLLSSMTQSREEAISRAMKLASILTAPSAITFALYSSVILSLFGPAYGLASPILRVLVLAALFTPIVSAYVSYAYALGIYSHVLLIGVVVNLGRYLLYVPLVLMFDAYGAAVAYAFGAVIGTLVMLTLYRKTEYKANWEQYALIVVVPIPLALISFYLNLHWILGAFLIEMGSFALYGRLGILTKVDVRDVLLGFFDPRRIEEVRKRLGRLVNFILPK